MHLRDDGVEKDVDVDGDGKASVVQPSCLFCSVKRTRLRELASLAQSLAGLIGSWATEAMGQWET